MHIHLQLLLGQEKVFILHNFFLYSNHDFFSDVQRETPSEFKSISSSSHLRPYENGSLVIHNAQKSDSGFYMCQANNGIGAGLSKVIKLTVHGNCYLYKLINC